MAAATRRRRVGFLDALLPYLGGKRRLLGPIAKALPPPSVACRLLDPFLGGGAVGLWAKRRGYEVFCNDVAERSAVVGSALIENSHVKLTRADTTRFFASSSGEPPGFVERVFGGEVLPERHARFLDGALPVAREVSGAKGAMMMLLLLHYVLKLRPMGPNFGAKKITRQMGAGDWEAVNPNFLRDHLARPIEGHPYALCEELRVKINAGVFSNGQKNEAHRRDVFDFLSATEGDVVYLDPPYGGTSAYETALKPLDSILAGRPVEAVPSEFSGRRAVEALERLFEAARHLPHWVVSYGNAMLGPEAVEAIVRRHRHEVRVEVIEYAHLPALASKGSKQPNREILITAWGRR